MVNQLRKCTMSALIINREKQVCQARWYSWQHFEAGLTRLLNITTNNNAIPGDWKKATMALSSKWEADQSLKIIGRSA
jgi:hypothetical protein